MCTKMQSLVIKSQSAPVFILAITCILLILAPFKMDSEARSVGTTTTSHRDGVGNSLIEVDANSYAVAGPKLAANGWAVVTVNEKLVTIYNVGGCEVVKKSLDNLSPQEQSLLQETKSNAKGLNGYQWSSSNSYGSNYQYSGSSSSSSVICAPTCSVTSGDNKFTYSGPELPPTIATLIRDNDIVTFVYGENQNQLMLAKPISCLDYTEQTILAEVEKINQESNNEMKRNIDKMNDNIDASMRQIQDNMQRFSQEMRFPFGMYR